MKLLVIGHNYYPELTGIGKYTSEFCSFLAEKEGHSVQVITAYPHYPQWKIAEGYRHRWFNSERIQGVKVLRVPIYVPANPSGFKRLLMDAFFILNAFIALNYLLLVKRRKFDYIFTPVPFFALGLLGLYYRFFSRKTKVLYHIQDLQIDAADNLGLIKNKQLLGLLRSVERFILQHVDHVSTISDGMQRKVLAKSSKLKECLLFPNWINNKNIHVITPKPVIHKDNLAGKRIILYSGAIGEKQGLEIIIEAARHFAAYQNDFVFIISGEGPYKEKLIADAAAHGLTNVLFYNLLPIDAFNELLNAAFLHLVIQKESGSDLFLPSKLTNILGIGGQVIVTATNGTSLYKILQDHQCGVLIEPMNIGELIDAITRLADNKELRAALSANALSYSDAFLNQRSVIDNYIVQVA